MLVTFLKIACPAVLTNSLGYLANVTNAVFAGNMADPINLAVVGLAGSSETVIFHSLLMGLNAAQETLTSQAFGAGNLRLCGIYLNRGHFILIAFFIPLAVVPSIFAE